MIAANDNLPPTFISMFSGIEAASVAFNPLGWRAICFAEIEKFPAAVLAHHYPHTPNVGDMSKHDWSQYHGKVDIVCGGPPCQAFSVAGLRESLNDDRGNLSIVYMKALHAIKPRNAIIENVPGWLSVSDNAFGCFLAGLVGADSPLVSTYKRGRWPNAGMVAGPKGRAAWAIKDAQFFGLAQRRKRVIVVADFGNGADPATVLFEPESVRRDSPPSRETGQGVAGTISARTKGGGGLGTDFDLDGGLVHAIQERAVSENLENGPQGKGFQPDIAYTLEARNKVQAVAYAPEIARCDATREGSSQDYESTTMVAVFDPNQITSRTNRSNPTPELCHTLPAVSTPPICFSAKDYGADASNDLAPTLRAGGHTGSHANAGVMPAIAFHQNQLGEVRTSEVVGTLNTNANASGRSTAMALVTSAVRRLTPRECERLQGFPDDYTRIPWRGKPAERCPDGPRYKALGNSWAVPLFAWLGERIARLMPPTAANDNNQTQVIRDAA